MKIKIWERHECQGKRRVPIFCVYLKKYIYEKITISYEEYMFYVCFEDLVHETFARFYIPIDDRDAYR